MIATKDNETAALPDCLEGWKARADYFESLYKNEKLAHAKTRTRFFGRSSEKLTDAQRQLFGILPGILPGTFPPPLSEQTKALMKEARKGAADRGSDEPKRKRGGRNWERFEGLPTEVELIHPPIEERAGKVWATQEITDHIEHIPSRTIHHIAVRTVWMDPKHASPPVIAELPADLKVFPASMYGLNFMIGVVIGKFADHLPLYRQAGIDARDGVWISRQARNRIIDNAAHLLITIAEQTKRKILRSGYFQIDETVTKLKDPERRGRSHDAYFWGLLAPHEKAVYFQFEARRSEKTLFDLIPVGWRGDVQTDGGAWYLSAFADMPFVRHFECMAHLRRYVLAAAEGNEEQVKPLLEGLAALYRIERTARRGKFTHEQRERLRVKEATPILEHMRKTFLALEDDPRSEGALLEAVTYANGRGRWQRLCAYALPGNGHIFIDNNLIENKFRPTKIGRKNWMFIGHPKTGWRSAVLYTVLGTCRMLNVNPTAYLRWVLPLLAEGTNQTTAEGLLPHDFAALFPEHVMEPQRH